jgi:hypothetical protein
MCTYTTVQVPMTGSGKGPGGNWISVSRATVYVDHPVHMMADHTLNIDLTDPRLGQSGRVAMELTAESARALIAAIETALASVPADLAV